MKKLLYITVNSKPESISACRTVGRAFVNSFTKKNPEFQVEELDLYSTHIPRLEYQYFEKRNGILSTSAIKDLPENEQKELNKIINLCKQFVAADLYVFAAPMWSLSFPAPLKEYIDCIVQDGYTISFPKEDKKPVGLLNDKPRAVVYIQSSGGEIPFVARPIINKGLDYVEDIMKFMGIKQFERLLVDGTGTSEQERILAIAAAKEKINKLVDKIKLTENVMVSS